MSMRADREAASAQAANDFLHKDLLGQASAASQSGRAPARAFGDYALSFRSPSWMTGRPSRTEFRLT